MSSTFNNSIRTVLFSVVVLGLAIVTLWYGASLNNTTATVTTLTAPSATFAGVGVGPIPDLASGCQPNQGTPLNVTFNVTGTSGAPTNVALSTTFGGPNHSWAGDVTATLIAPNGASHSVFGRVIATTSTAAGDSSDLGGVYTFADANVMPPSGGFWQAATAEATGSQPIANGAYRTTGAGGAGATNPMPATNMNAAFAGVTNANGTWTLRLTDGCAADTGAISAATLTVDTAAVPTGPKNADFDGDGKTDFAMGRDTTPLLSGDNEFFRAETVREKLRLTADRKSSGDPDSLVPGTTITWFVNPIATPSTHNITQFGEAATDFVVPSDYDGDLKTDIAVWRPGAADVAAFYILQSSNSTVRTELFGITGDDPAITGDYDGDGKSDVAVQRCPPIGSPGQCFFFYRGSNANPGGNITYVPFGSGQQFDFFANPGDFDGDGKFDFCLQRTAPSGSPAGQFVLLRSSDGGVEYINWGLNSDIIVPGDYDGDGKADFMVSRTSAGARQYYLLTRTGGGTGASPIVFGIAGDVRTPGDYDGDGKTDIAVWRPSATPSLSRFWILKSSDGGLIERFYGSQGDVAAAGWAVH